MTRAPLLMLVLPLLACGYHLAGSGAVPSQAQTIGIKLFTNRGQETGLEVQLRRAIEDEFRRRGPLRVVPGDDADVVLSGRIRRFASVPVAFSSASDEALQYQSVIQVAFRLTERSSGRVLHDTKLLQEAQDFGAERGVVITSSPHCQRGTIDGRDLPDLTNVQIGEARRRAASSELLDALARDVYQQVMEGF